MWNSEAATPVPRARALGEKTAAASNKAASARRQQKVTFQAVVRKSVVSHMGSAYRFTGLSRLSLRPQTACPMVGESRRQVL